MRHLAKVLVFVALFSPAAFAQTAPFSAPDCNGIVANVRISDIKAESMKKFEAAVAAHQQWYTSHGYADVILMTPILLKDDDSRRSSISQLQAITYHFYTTGLGPEPKHDAAWDAFVRLYNESSTVKVGYYTCIPKSMSPLR